MTPLEIRSQLLLKNITGREIARRTKVKESMVSMVIYRKRENRKVRQEIATILGKDIAEIFADAA